MQKQKLFRVLSLLLVIALSVLVLAFFTRLCMPKYQRGIVEGAMTAEYYRDGSAHDVLFIGDCELYENVSTVELWRKYGIPSYIRGSAQQLVWHSYYLLRDALRSETPKVVVFNVLSLKYNEPQSESYNRMAIDGMRLSLDKLGAIRASMTDEEQFIEYIFPILRYHSRLTDLKNEDFAYLFRRENVTSAGYYMRADVKPEADFPPPMPLSDYTLGEKAMGYLNKMADLCEKKGIALVLVKAPTLYPHWYDEWDEQIASFAKERGIAYRNLIPLRDEIGLDMTKDTYDAGLHLNLSGAEKTADYLGAWLQDEFDLPDRRDDPELSEHWSAIEADYEATKAKQLDELERYGELRSFGANAIES